MVKGIRYLILLLTGHHVLKEDKHLLVNKLPV